MYLLKIFTLTFKLLGKGELCATWGGLTFDQVLFGAWLCINGNIGWFCWLLKKW